MLSEPLHDSSAQSNTKTQVSIDPRIQNISYSSLLTLHSCPRKFQLEKYKAIRSSQDSESDTITFSYGHTVGHGIQLCLEEHSYENVLWEMFLMWHAELFAENPKQNKSFASAVYAIQKFRAMRAQGYLEGYSLVQYNGKPACELSFLIHLPGGFKYRGSVDAVLQHNETGKIIVLECKTSSATNLDAAKYRNSAQAIGYSIVLDSIFPELSSYDVLYIEFSTKTLQWEQLTFSKSYTQRARWIQELVLDVEVIGMYEDSGTYPMHGESCLAWNRECKYLGLCHMSDHLLMTDITPADIVEIEKDYAKWEIKVTLEDLINTQIAKTT